MDIKILTEDECEEALAQCKEVIEWCADTLWNLEERMGLKRRVKGELLGKIERMQRFYKELEDLADIEAAEEALKELG